MCYLYAVAQDKLMDKFKQHVLRRLTLELTKKIYFAPRNTDSTGQYWWQSIAVSDEYSSLFGALYYKYALERLIRAKMSESLNISEDDIRIDVTQSVYDLGSGNIVRIPSVMITVPSHDYARKSANMSL